MLRILLVEDNPADAQMLQTALRQAGEATEVILMTNGVKALEYLAGENRSSGRPCDLVLLDLNLPGLGGFDILKHLRACEDYNSLPVIVMSGSSDPMEVERCYRAGANSYICKPTHLDDILATTAEFVAYWSHCVRLPSRGLLGSAVGFSR